MIKKMATGFLFITLLTLPVFLSCDSGSGTAADRDPQSAAAAFDRAFRPSCVEVTAGLNTVTDIDSIEDIIKEQIVKINNPAFNAILEVAISDLGEESIDTLMALIKSGILNPWTLLDDTSLAGKHGCVTWSAGVDLNLQLTQAIEDYFNNDWWTVNLLAELEECSDVSGEFSVAISGSKLGVVYKVHAVGNFTMASVPESTYAVDIVYDLENCLGKWDCVDWSGTVNGNTISDL